MLYTGFPLNKDADGSNNYGPTNDSDTCQILCQETELCGWFNWDEGDCWLKTEKGLLKEKTGSFSGPRTCDS